MVHKDPLQVGELRNKASEIDAQHWLDVYADLLEFAQEALAHGTGEQREAVAKQVLVLRQGIEYWLAVRTGQIEEAQAKIERVRRLLAYPAAPLPTIEAVKELLEPLPDR